MLPRLGLSNPPALASPRAGITGVSHGARPQVLLILFNYFMLFLGPSLALSPRLEGSGTNVAYYSLDLPGSNDPPTSASQVAETTGVCHHTRLILYFFSFSQFSG